MDWEKHGSINTPASGSGTRRLAVPVTDQLQGAIDEFKGAYAPRKFSNADVLKTMIEAGFKLWYGQRQAQQTEEQPDASQA